MTLGQFIQVLARTEEKLQLLNLERKLPVQFQQAATESEGALVFLCKEAQRNSVASGR